MHSLSAALCALALAGILISPAVPSPPTVVGKAAHASITVLGHAVLPAMCLLASFVLGPRHHVSGAYSDPGSSIAGSVFAPLRR